jgi:hypothetical protein
MTRAGLLLGASLTASAIAQEAPQAPVFRTRTDVVVINVSVKQGRNPVTGLTAADFRVLDNGVEQQVDQALLDRLSIDVTLVLTGFRDTLREEHAEGLDAAAAIRTRIKPDDRLRVVMVSDSVRGALVGPGYRTPNREAMVQRIPGVSVIDGLFYALAWPVEPDRRHLVIAFTDGWDRWSTLHAGRIPKLAERSDAVMHLALWASPYGRADRAIFSLNNPGFASTSFQIREWEETFRPILTAAERTGGTSRPAGSGTQALEQILEDFRTSYVLRYSPRGVEAAGWHSLDVKIRKPGGYTIRARKGYEG